MLTFTSRILFYYYLYMQTLFDFDFVHLCNIYKIWFYDTFHSCHCMLSYSSSIPSFALPIPFCLLHFVQKKGALLSLTPCLLTGMPKTFMKLSLSPCCIFSVVLFFFFLHSTFQIFCPALLLNLGHIHKFCYTLFTNFLTPLTQLQRYYIRV